MEAELKNKVEYLDGTNSDIIKVLEKNLPIAECQTRQFAKRFDAPTIEQIAENVWNFLKENITYVSDGTEHQKIRLPARLIHDKEGDCKSFALFAASILSHYTQVGFRYSSYRNDPTPTHVYAICKDEDGNTIIIDGVWHTFNDEKNFKHKKDHWMKISTLSGTGDNQSHIIPQIKVDEYTYHALASWEKVLQSAPKGSKEAQLAEKSVKEILHNIGLSPKAIKQQSLQGIGKHHWWQHLKDKVHSALKGAWNGYKHFNPAFSTIRNSYLALLDINYRGQATRIVEQLQIDDTKLKDLWVNKFGGNFQKLINAAKRGAKHKPFLGTPHGMNGPELVIAIVAAAAPLLALISKLIPKGKKIEGEPSTDPNSPNYNSKTDPTSPDFDPNIAAQTSTDIHELPHSTTKPLSIFQTILKDGKQVVDTVANIVNPQDESGATKLHDITPPVKESSMGGGLTWLLIGGVVVTAGIGLFKRNR